MPTYNFDTRSTSRYEIEAEIVDGALGQSSIEEQAALYDGNAADMAQAVADFYEGENVKFVDFDDEPLSVANYAESYFERQLAAAR